MHFHINNVTGIWIGNYNYLVSSSNNIPQFPYFGRYTKILTEIGRSPFHHTFTESSCQTKQSISRVDCHFFQAVILPSVLHAGGTGRGGSKPPNLQTSHLLYLAFPARALHPPFSSLSSVSMARYLSIVVESSSNSAASPFRSLLPFFPLLPPVPQPSPLLSPSPPALCRDARRKEIVVQYPSSNMTLLYRRSIILIKLRCDFKSKRHILMELVP